MKPLRLELRGFTAFRRPAVVDFRDRTLFAITGPTGAGKSSLLDAMTWALYGLVPRVGRSTHQLVTHGEKSMAVRFDFAARGHVYRVTRTTAGAIGTRLEERVDGEAEGERWRLLADRAGEVTRKVGEVIGLDYATFIKTIVLPQGEFGSFLRGEERERRDILSTLLGLGSYEAAGRAARARAREAQQSSVLLTRQLEQLAYTTPDALAGLDAERATLTARAAGHVAMREGLATLGAAAATHVEATRALAEAQRGESVARQTQGEAERALAEVLTTVEQARTAHDRFAAERAGLGYDAEVHRRLQQAVQLLEARHAAAQALEAARTAELQAGTQLDEARRVVAAAERARDEQCAVALAACAAHEVALASLCRTAFEARALALGLRGAEGEAETAALAAEQEAARLAEAARQAEAFAGEARAIAAEEARTGSELSVAQVEIVMLEQASADGARGATLAEGALGERRDALQSAHAAHAAAALRSGLAHGDDCPVCGGHIDQLPLHETPDLDIAAAAVAEAEAVLRAALDEQRSALARAAAAAARVEGLEAECVRQRARRATLEAGVRAAGLRCGEGEPAEETALARAAAEALAGAERAQVDATTQRTKLAALRDARHDLELRLAEAAPRVVAQGAGLLDDVAEPELAASEATATAAHKAATALAERLVAEGTQLSAATTAEEAARLADATGQRAAEEAGRAAQALEARSEAVAAAQRHLESLTGGDLDGAWGADPGAAAAALAAQDALAAQAAALEEAMRAATTELAVRSDRAEQGRAQLERAAKEATAAAAVLEVAGCAAETAEAAFAEQWRGLLGVEAAPSVVALQQLTQQVEAEAREVAQRMGSIEARLEQARGEIARAERLRLEIATCESTAAVAGALERELHADRFIAYVQREALAVLAADASSRLLHLTGGRYRLVGEADEFYVIDHLNGDERRSVRTLSGGETFLASLALALALSERLPELAGAGGALSLESLFLDEGFGSLDAASLDIAIEGLERLAGGRRVIGVISHVPEIAERLPDRIEVLKAPEGSSIAAGRAAPRVVERARVLEFVEV